MCVLSDHDITQMVTSKSLEIRPFDPQAVQPASYDLHLAKEYRRFRRNHQMYIDTKKPDTCTELCIADGILVVHPNEFLLASTIEFVAIPPTLVARIDGRSSLGRLGLLVHATAGYVDPGFNGTLTLELSNQGSLPITLDIGMAIAQISFLQMSSPAVSPYGAQGRNSKYQGQESVTSSRIHLDIRSNG